MSCKLGASPVYYQGKYGVLIRPLKAFVYHEVNNEYKKALFDTWEEAVEHIEKSRTLIMEVN